MDLEVGKQRGYGREGGVVLKPQRSAAHGEARAPFTAMWVLVALMAFPMFAFISGVHKPPVAPLVGPHLHGMPSHRPRPQTSAPPRAPQQRRMEWLQKKSVKEEEGTRSSSPRLPSKNHDDQSSSHGVSDEPRDKYLGGLLADGFDEDSCQSRYQSTMYRKLSPHKPSPYLLQKLRDYEQRHRRCAPLTAGYNATLRFLDSGPAPAEETECKYILWWPWSGLGNRILSLTSAFLYALLTDRVLLIYSDNDMPSLFCEPFPGTTWLLPPDFSIPYFWFDERHPLSYGNLLRNKNVSTDGKDRRPPPSMVYLHLSHNYETEDMHIFCEPDQKVLKKVPWLLFSTNNYVVPGYFLNRDFEPELSRMFPVKETVFHHLGRYLFHPTNDVWGLVTRYYRSYLAAAREKVGIQIRVFDSKDAPFEVVSKQILHCIHKKRILPRVDGRPRPGATPADPNKTKAVLITSLYSGYFEKLRDMYWEHSAAGGAIVSVHQPTHEESQQTDKASHDQKAWAEMYLLSLSDVLVTSAHSTFGYVGQGLGGIRPWILSRPEKGVRPEPSCVREVSMEPCFQYPTHYVCGEKREGDNAGIVPFVTHCMDVGGGLKLVDARTQTQ